MANYAATEAVDDETYFALTAHEGGSSYSSVSAGWTDHQNDGNSDARVDIFMNDGAGHLAADLPAITITRGTATGDAWCFLIAAGDTSNASINHVFGNSGNGDDIPNATFTIFTPNVGACLIFILTIDNDGELVDHSGPDGQGYELIAESGEWGNGKRSYVFMKFPSTGDQGPDDRFNFGVHLNGTNIHWVIQGYDVNGLGSTQGCYVIDHGLMTVAGNDLSFTASEHGDFAPPPMAFVDKLVEQGNNQSSRTWKFADPSGGSSPTPGDGDLAVLAFTLDGTKTMTAHPDGFTLVNTPSTNAEGNTTYIYSRVCDGTELNDSNVHTFSGACNWAFVISWYSNPTYDSVYIIDEGETGSTHPDAWHKTFVSDKHPTEDNQPYIGVYTSPNGSNDGGGFSSFTAGGGFSPTQIGRTGDNLDTGMCYDLNTAGHADTDFPELNNNYGQFSGDPGQTYHIILGVGEPPPFVEYTDADTVTLTGVPSGVEVYTQPSNYTDAATALVVAVVRGIEHEIEPGEEEARLFDVDDATDTIYVRAAHGNIITVTTDDNPITFKLQTSPDGETWYDALDPTGTVYEFDVTHASGGGVAVNTPPGWFHLRLKVTDAPDGPATARVGFNGGY